MKRERRYIVVLLLCGLLCFYLATAAFTDAAAGWWYSEAVEALEAGGLLKGYPDGSFHPELEMSRSEFIAVIARCVGRDSGAAGDYWNGQTIADAKEAGWLPRSWMDEPIGPEGFEVPIVREEAVYLLMTALAPEDGGLGIREGDIRDFDSIAPDLQSTVLAAYNAGITKGVPGGGFAPRTRLTRGQAAVLLYRAGYTAAKEPEGAAALRCSWTLSNSWNSDDGRFAQYELTLESAGSDPITAWSFQAEGGGEVTQYWNCQLENRGNGITISPVDYNREIRDRASVGFIVRDPAYTRGRVTADTAGGRVEKSVPAPWLSAAPETVPGPASDPPSTPPELTSDPPSTPPDLPVASPLGTAPPLHVEGTLLADPEGNGVQLRGVSTHGLAWYPEYVNLESFRTLQQDWGCNVVRLAMYTAEYGGYCSGGDREGLKALIDKGVRAASELGMYVILDWHILSDGNPMAHQQEAVEFFDEMSRKYREYDNVLYEICNEPQNSPWAAVIKPYAETVLAAIRANDPDAVVIVGTNTWSQDVEEVIGNQINDRNVVYSFHFYAATHKDSYRRKVTRALDSGVPVFVSECGFCDASGGGGVDRASAEEWLELLNRRGVSFVAWSLCNKNETAALLKPSCIKTSGWIEEDLSESGLLFRQAILGR